MKNRILGAAVLTACMWSAAAFAAEVKFPAKIGESEAAVKERLGAPESVFFDDIMNANEWGYKSRGFTVTAFAKTGAVASVSVLGNHHDPAAGTYTGGLIDDLGMNDTLDRFVAKFGPGEKQEDTVISGSSRYQWAVDGYLLRINVWDENHTGDGTVHPKGSILSAEILDPAYQF